MERVPYTIPVTATSAVRPRGPAALHVQQIAHCPGAGSASPVAMLSADSESWILSSSPAWAETIRLWYRLALSIVLAVLIVSTAYGHRLSGKGRSTRSRAQRPKRCV